MSSKAMNRETKSTYGIEFGAPAHCNYCGEEFYSPTGQASNWCSTCWSKCLRGETVIPIWEQKAEQLAKVSEPE